MPAAGQQLPRHHLDRPRLVAAVRSAPTAAVIAGGGYGKTTLALEVARALGIGCAIAHLESGDDGPDALVRRLSHALRQSGLSDAAEALAGADAPDAALGRLSTLLTAGEDPVLLVIDEISQAGVAGGAFIAQLAEQLPGDCRLVLLGRTLPPPLAPLARMPGVVGLGQPELAFTDEETASLLERAGVGSAGALAPRLRRLAEGWPVALTLAAELLVRAGDPEAELERLEGDRTLLAGLVDAPLAILPPSTRDGVLQVVYLPHVTVEIADTATGVDGLVDRACRAGLPFDVAPDGRVSLPDPVRDVLASREGLTRAVARRAADEYGRLGMGHEAVRVLVAAGDADGAAAAAAGLSPGEVSRFDVRELRALLAPIAPAALDRHPRALMHLARACEASADRSLRGALLERVAALGEGDPALAREVDAEVGRDLVRDGRVEEAAALAERLLREAGPQELQTRVRALHVLGRTHAWRGDAAGLAAAEPMLEEAAALYAQLGFHAARAHALLALAYDVHTLGGRFAAAVETLERALAGLAGSSRLRGVVLTFLGEALTDLGRLPEAEASFAEAERLGVLFGDTRTLAYVAWLRARSAASLGDAGRVCAQLREAERHRGAWYEHHSGVEFLAEAALLLDQVDELDAAAGYLERARERAAEAVRYVRLAEGAAEARRGDPAAAEATLAAVAAMPDLEVREAWRVALLRGYAAHRAGHADRAAELAREAFGLAARTEAPDLPLRREPAVAAALQPLADTGSTTAVRSAAGGQVSITVLGGFEARRGVVRLGLPPGQPTALVKLVAVSGGRMQVDEVIEALWPGTGRGSGRKRLRNVLNRLRERAGDLVVRDGDALSLDESAEVDAVLFEERAVAALADGRLDRARAALGLYAGELLPDDRYEAWAAEPRERARTRALRLLDVLAVGAEHEGEVDEALRMLERGIEADPLDESRYLQAARLLLRQGKRGRALALMRSAAATMRELGLEPSDEHRALVRSTRG